MNFYHPNASFCLFVRRAVDFLMPFIIWYSWDFSLVVLTASFLYLLDSSRILLSLYQCLKAEPPYHINKTTYAASCLWSNLETLVDVSVVYLDDKLMFMMTASWCHEKSKCLAVVDDNKNDINHVIDIWTHKTMALFLSFLMEEWIIFSPLTKMASSRCI